jgi:hypothetical protein
MDGWINGRTGGAVVREFAVVAVQLCLQRFFDVLQVVLVDHRVDVALVLVLVLHARERLGRHGENWKN